MAAAAFALIALAASADNGVRAGAAGQVGDVGTSWRVCASPTHGIGAAVSIGGGGVTVTGVAFCSWAPATISALAVDAFDGAGEDDDSESERLGGSGGLSAIAWWSFSFVLFSEVLDDDPNGGAGGWNVGAVLSLRTGGFLCWGLAGWSPLVAPAPASTPPGGFGGAGHDGPLLEDPIVVSHTHYILNASVHMPARALKSMC